MKTTWKLIGHSHQIADTGDYDGYYEITNGKISIYTKDNFEEALQPIIDALNNSECIFYTDDWVECENYLLKEENERLKEQLRVSIPLNIDTANTITFYAEPCLMQSAFQLDNDVKIIVYTSCYTGIASFQCNDEWKPNKEPFATCPRNAIEGSLTQYHKNIREMHGPDKLVKEHSTEI